MDKNLAKYFILSMRKNQLFQILKRIVVREEDLSNSKKGAKLVKSCLSLHANKNNSWANGHEENKDELSDLYTILINYNTGIDNIFGQYSSNSKTNSSNFSGQYSLGSTSNTNNPFIQNIWVI
ncbi:hypothetical protein H5410_046383 [Solanum commersonii]|uniref:Uncharacterized protein n=1 Tax=Solanum commersonii TaxID=4109 RepID=A0A9J5XE67_SOLCO|nr:hypothetical protein H5410_046383 [Solanum commersonii]